MELHSLETNPEYLNLQTELVRMQRWVQENNKRVLIIFEGRDTAGKGGAIMRFVRFLNPRAYRIVALPKPTDIEKGQWFFQRYIKALPNPGQLVFFDRSWYNRAVVEPVMGFCSLQQYEDFMGQVVLLENILVQEGIYIIKLWFSINAEEQNKRLAERQQNPLQQWKLSTVDMLAQQKWDEYSEYKLRMFEKTGTQLCPWVVIKGEDKDKARLEAMRYVIDAIDFPEKGQTGERFKPDPEVVSIISH